MNYDGAASNSNEEDYFEEICRFISCSFILKHYFDLKFIFKTFCI